MTAKGKKQQEQGLVSLATLEKLLQVGQSLILVQDLEPLLQQIAESVGSGLGADVVVLYEYDEEANDVTVPPVIWGDIHHPEVPREKSQMRPHKESAVFTVLDRTEPFYASNAAEDWAHLIEGWHTPNSFVNREGIISSAAVPLMVEGKRVGALFVNYRTHHTFPDEEQKATELFATQAAIAIQNARLFNDSQRRIRDLEIVNEVVEKIGTKLDTQDLLQTIVSQIADKLDCTHCTLFFQQEENSQPLLVPQVTHGVRSKEIMTRRFKPDEGLAGWVFQHGKSLILKNATDDPRFSPARDQQDKPRSMMIAPVKAGDQTIGIISADQDKYGWFSENDQRLVDALARQAGIAIERAIGLQLVRDVGNQIIGASQVQVDAILQQIVSGAIKLTNTTAGIIFLLSEDGRSVTRQFEHPPDFNHPPPRLDGEGGITRQIFATGEVKSFPKIHQDPLVNPEMHSRVQSMIGVPLKLEEKVIGVLYLNDAEPHSFTETEISLLSTLTSQAAIAIQNARLFEESRQRTKELALLHDVGSQLMTFNLDELLSLIVQGAMDLTAADSGFVYLLNKDGTRILRFVALPLDFSSSFSPDGPPTHTSRNGLTRYIFETAEPAFIPDTSQDDRVNPVITQAGIKSFFGQPLKVSNRVVGVLYLNRASFGQFSESQRSLISTLAGQAAIAIDNARLFEDTQRRSRDMGIVNDVVEIIGTKLDPKNLLQTIVSQIADKLDCTHCTLFFPQEEQGELLLVPQVTHGVRKEILTRRFKPTEGLVGLVFQNGESLVLDDVTGHPNFAPARDKRDEPRSMLVAPVKAGDQTIGVISADQDKFGWFSEDDRRLADALGRQAGIAIQRATGLQLLRDIGNRIISAPQVDEILQQIVSGAIKLTHTTAGVIYLLSESGRSVTKSFEHPPGSNHPAPRLDGEGGITRRIFATGEAMLFPKVRQSPLVNPEMHDRIQSMIGVPLKLEEKVIGVLYLNDTDEHKFTETEVSLLSTLASQAAVAIQNAMLFETRQRLNDQLESLHRVILEPNLNKVLDRIAEGINAILGEEVSPTINLYRQDANSFGECHACGPLQDKLKVPPRAKGTARHVLETGKSLYLEDVLNPPPGCPTIRQESIDMGIKSFAAIPLRWQEPVVGVLFVNAQKRLSFSEEIKRVLELFASQAAIAIENANLFAQERQRADTMDLLRRVSAMISTTLDVKKSLALIVKGAVEFTDTEAGVIHLIDETKQTISDSHEFPEGFGHLSSRFSQKKGLTWQAFNTGEIVEVLDVPQSTRVSQELSLRGVKSTIGVPLKLSGNVIGVLFLSSFKQRIFTPDEKALLTTLAEQAALAIQNARLFERSQELRVIELEALSQLGDDLAALEQEF